MKTYFAPGRVNLIGEHLDYNGGLVLPAALSIGITATVTTRVDNCIALSTDNHSLSKQFDLDDDIEWHKENDWTNYPLGVIAHLKKEGIAIPALNIHYESNLPEGSGLSSSAAVEVLTAYILLTETNSKVNLVWLAEFCRNVENEFIGVKCGIMDQFSVALGKRDNAILLDCHTLNYQYIPFETDDYRLMIMNSNKPRSLVHSKYNERKQECEEALKTLQATYTTLSNLCEAEMHQLSLIINETVKRRAQHVVSENLRVKESVKVLRYGDLSTFGRLMNASHRSLKEDYEVTGVELDTLAETAQQVKGCLGARMTGAGFGGCAIALVHQQALEKFVNTVGESYLKAVGINCSFYETQIVDGVRKLT
jgi:galactokinase